MEHLAPYHATKVFDLKDTWSIGPFSKFSSSEKQVLSKALKEQVNTYQEMAAERYNDDKNTSLMISQNEHKIRNEVMRRNKV